MPKETRSSRRPQARGDSDPAWVPYWFAKGRDERLEIMRVGATAQNEKNERINYTPLLARQTGRHLE